MSDNIDVQLTSFGADLILRDDDGTPDGWQLSPDELTELADKATEALAAMKGWEWLHDLASTLAVNDMLAFTESHIVGVGPIHNANAVEVYLADGHSLELGSNMKVSYLRRIA